jgi:hypothetical protein
VCSSEADCIAPTFGILHKLDQACSDYVDYPSSRYLRPPPFNWRDPGGGCHFSCLDDLERYKDTFTSGFYWTDAGAYQPYMNGTLFLYAKAGQVDEYCAHGQANPANCFLNCDWYDGCGGNVIRLGNDEGNFWEYGPLKPTWDGGTWKRYAFSLRTPSRIVGRPKWNLAISFLQFNNAWISACPNTARGPCELTLDYVYLTKT